jgi:hypothetical protein
MGFRTVVVLNNDQTTEWEFDTKLGQRISWAAGSRCGDERELPYGRVVECVHADTQTLGYFDSHRFVPLLYSNWTRDETEAEVKLRMLKQLADSMGYSLRKKPAK